MTPEQRLAQTTEQDLALALSLVLLHRHGDVGLANGVTVRGHQSLASAGVRHNEGLVLDLSDGTSFHLTVNRSA